MFENQIATLTTILKDKDIHNYMGDTFWNIIKAVSDIENYIGNPQLETLYALATYLHISIDAIFSNQKTNPDSTMQQIMAELNSCPEEQKQLALSTLRGLLDGFKNLS